MNWKDKAIKLLAKSLKPVPQELNEIDWKGALSDDKERLAQHICAFSNLNGGGILVYGVNNDASFVALTKDEIELIINRLDNIAQNRMFTPVQLEHAVMEYEGNALLFVYIPEYREKPMYLRGSDIYDSFVRSAGHTVRASRQQVRQMIADSEGVSYENRVAKQGLTKLEVLELLNYAKLFELLNHQLPSTEEGILDFMEELNICCHSSAGYSITNLGALLFAKSLSSFDTMKGKGVVVRRYVGNNNRQLLLEQEGAMGYAVGLEGLINYVMKNTGTEHIDGAVRELIPSYPRVAIREFVANALVHQDFAVKGMPITIEIFANRLVITNPGYSLNDVNRLIDLPPHSRNEQMAQLMLQLGLCERRGSGVDRAVEALEKMCLPAYKAESGDDYTRITLYPKKSISTMTREERIEACYQHCCLTYADNEPMNNQSVRERFGLNKNQGTIASHIISDTVSKGLIKSANPESESRKFVSYVPFYA
jgi:predicted HTH transcriptional regulator